MMKLAQDAQQRLQQQMTEMRVEATASGRMVTATVNGLKHLLTLTIDGVVSDDVRMLQDLVAAGRDAHRGRTSSSARSAG
jgi:DNA-binding protein YbaB